MTTPEANPNGVEGPGPNEGASGTGGLVLGILALFASFAGVIPIVGLFAGIAAMAMAVLGLVLSLSAKKNGAGGNATAGIVLAAIAFLLGGSGAACQAVCATQMNEGMKEAGFEGGFGDFAAMIGEAAQMGEKLDAKARDEGYDSFDQWMSEDPEGAQEAQRVLTEEFSARIAEENPRLKEKMEEAAAEAERAGAAMEEGAEAAAEGAEEMAEEAAEDAVEAAEDAADAADEAGE